MTEPIPKLTPGEWQAIKPVLPIARSMRGRHRDRDIVAALLFCEAAGISIEAVAPRCGISFWTLRTRKRRWQTDGSWPQILERGMAAIARIRRDIGQDDLMQQLATACGWDRL
jgi:transposase